MEKEKGEQVMSNDYFADGLLAKLDAADPVFAAYEAQDVSRDVGFDFADFQDVVPRALDEIRETKEAYEEQHQDVEGHEHFGDEIADIMFSLINLARHAGLNDLPSLDDLLAKANVRSAEEINTIELVDDIGTRIVAVADVEKTDQEKIKEAMGVLFEEGMVDSILIANANDFDPKALLVENVRKYLDRCQAIEQLAAEDGKQWSDLSANNEIIAYWKRAKTLLK